MVVVTARYTPCRARRHNGRPGWVGRCESCGTVVTPDNDTAFTTSGMVTAAMGDHDCWAFWHELFAEFQEVGA